MALGKNEIVAGTKGRDIEIDTKLDLTEFAQVNATTELTVKPPKGPITSWSTSFKNDDPTNGILVHTLLETEVDTPGDYLIHAIVDNGNDKRFPGDLFVLGVKAMFTLPRK